MLKKLGEKSVCRLVCVPSFRATKSIVLVDLTNLQSYEYKFDASLIANTFETNQLDFSQSGKLPVDDSTRIDSSQDSNWVMK